MAHVLIPGLSRGSVGAICTQAASWALPARTLRSLTLASVMKSRRKTDHLERTATVLRREVCVCGAWWGSWLGCLHTDWLIGEAIGEAGPHEGQSGRFYPPEQSICN